MKIVIIAVLVSVSFYAGNLGAIADDWESELNIFNASWNDSKPELSFRFGEEDACYTPNGVDGDCIPLKQCKLLFGMFMRLRTLSITDQIYLKQSQCGWDRRGPLVCCSNKNDDPGQMTPRIGLSESDMPRTGICGTEISDHIHGGDTTDLTEYPWFALIEYTKRTEKKKGYLCGGSLINNNYVITAAHCIKDGKTKNGWKTTGVRLGEHDLTTNPDSVDDHEADPVLDVGVAEIIVHEHFHQQSNDIALLRLAHPVEYTDYIRPICLPFSRNVRNRVYEGAILIVTGFGQTQSEWSSDVKLKVKVNGFNFNRCNQIYSANGALGLTRMHLCAGDEKGKDSCKGDSGGPLMGEDRSDESNPYMYLAGIVSFGLRECGKGNPAVYTRVDQYLNWILEHMRH